MTITIRNYRTGETIRTWNQPGTASEVENFAMQYAVGEHCKTLRSKRGVEVWVIPTETEDE